MHSKVTGLGFKIVYHYWRKNIFLKNLFIYLSRNSFTRPLANISLVIGGLSGDDTPRSPPGLMHC